MDHLFRNVPECTELKKFKNGVFCLDDCIIKEANV